MSMLGLGKAGTVRAPAAAIPACDREIYQRYAARLYRKALLNPADLAEAGQGASDAIVNECALAAMPERGEGDARYRQGALRLMLSSGLRYIRRRPGAGDP